MSKMLVKCIHAHKDIYDSKICEAMCKSTFSYKHAYKTMLCKNAVGTVLEYIYGNYTLCKMNTG